MKTLERAGLLVVGVILAGGMVAGAAPPPNAGPPNATPAGGATEERFDFGVGPGYVHGCPHLEGFQLIGTRYCPAPASYAEPSALVIDSARYPAGVTMRFDTLLTFEYAGVDICLRIFDVTAGAAVPGTTVCRRVGEPWTKASAHDRPPHLTPEQRMRVTSPPVPLPSGAHGYVLEMSHSPTTDEGWSGGFPFGTSLILHW